MKNKDMRKITISSYKANRFSSDKYISWNWNCVNDMAIRWSLFKRDKGGTIVLTLTKEGRI